MPMPKRASVDDYFAQLTDTQRPHLEALRQLSRDADPQAREVLKWNLPVGSASRRARRAARGRFDPAENDEDPADRLNLRFKRSDAEES